MIDILVNSFTLLVGEKCVLFSADEYKYIAYFYRAIILATPAIVLLLCTVDIAQAAISQEDSEMKKAQGRALKRLIAGAAMFFVPVVLNLILGAVSGDINLGGACANQVANDKADRDLDWNLQNEKK